MNETMTTKRAPRKPLDHEPERLTSISAQIVRMGTVTMSFGDMECLYGILQMAIQNDHLDGYQIPVANETMAAIESIR